MEKSRRGGEETERERMETLSALWWTIGQNQKVKRPGNQKKKKSCSSNLVGSCG